MKTVAQMLLIKSKQSPVRLMGFREWCEKVCEPSMLLREERRLMLEIGTERVLSKRTAKIQTID